MACAPTQHLSADSLTRFERLAVRLYPHRSSLLAAGLGAFLLAALPLMGVVHGEIELAPWHAMLFGVSVPMVLWGGALGCIAIFFHPVSGLVGRLDPGWSRHPRELRRFLRGYAMFTVWAFAFAPIVVLAAAAS